MGSRFVNKRSMCFVNECYTYFAIIGLLGISQVIFNAIPSAIVSLVIPTEDLGNNLCILNCFCVTGQQVANFCLMVVIASFLIIRPTVAKVCKLDKKPMNQL